MEIGKERLSEITSNFGNVRVSVIGDFFLDLYHHLRKSGKIPTENGKSVYDVVKRETSPGAAGNVVRNLFYLGAKDSRVLGLVGKDGNAYDLIQEFDKLNLKTEGLIQTGRMLTNTYLKSILNGEEIERVDIESQLKTPKDLEDALIGRLPEVIEESDCVAVVDQVSMRNCGVLTDRFRKELCDYAGRSKKPFIVDSRERINEFYNCIIKINLGEARSALNIAGVNTAKNEEIVRVLNSLSKRPVFLTLGGEGAIVFDKNSIERIPPIDVYPVDVTGAGDAFTASSILALCSGASYLEAAQIGVIASGISVTKRGTGYVSREEIIEYKTLS